MTKDTFKDRPDPTGDVEDELAPLPPSVELDTAKYLPELADLDLTEAQKIEFLQTMWSIMQACARLSFNVDVCGQIFSAGDEFAQGARNDVSSHFLAATETNKRTQESPA